MKVFLYGLIIGICKIIPGVSGGMVAVSLGVYDKLVKSLCHFTDNKEENFLFLIEIGLGIILGIILFSKIILFLINNYYLIVITIFLIFIISSTIKYYLENNLKISNIIISILVSIISFSVFKGTSRYDISSIYTSVFLFFLAGIVEVISSVVPGVSGTSLLILMGMYDKVMKIISEVGNIRYVVENIMIYGSFTLGMIISFVGSILVIDYAMDKYRRETIKIIFYLQVFSIFSIIKNILIFFN